MIDIAEYISAWPGPWTAVEKDDPWNIAARAAELVAAATGRLGADYAIVDAVAVHRTATVESGVVLKGPLIIGPGCFVAAHCYLRGGVWLDEGCSLGPGCEVKSSFLFGRTRLAHFNFVGDSILGEDVNLEAGSIVANYRNELADRRLRLATWGGVIEAAAEKFGALIGDHARIGANAVIAPGALLAARAVVQRLALVDQRPPA
jgi:NDP-sugar pyrophosphorylase family protein